MSSDDDEDEPGDGRASEAEVQGCFGCLTAAGILLAVFSVGLGVPPVVAWIAVIVVVAAFAVSTFRRA